jgi:hypothetical protein
MYRDKQHIAVVLALNGLYPAKDVVRTVLTPQDGGRKSILDLGLFADSLQQFVSLIQLQAVAQGSGKSPNFPLMAAHAEQGSRNGEGVPLGRRRRG